MKLVVMTDMSPQSRGVLQLAAALGAKLNHDLEIFHALDLFGEMDDMEVFRLDPEEFRSAAIAEMQQRAVRLWREVTETMPDAPDASVEVVIGYPDEEAILLSEREDVALLVCGKSGQNRVIDELFGTTTGRLVRESSRPVLVTPTDWRPHPIRTILAPVDFSPCSRASLHYALDLAEQIGAAVTVLHAAMLPDVPVTAGEALSVPWDISEFQQQRAERLERWLADEGLLARVASTQLHHIAPHLAILEAAKDADLICMGTHGRRRMARFLLGNTAERVLRQTRTPLISLRDPS